MRRRGLLALSFCLLSAPAIAQEPPLAAALDTTFKGAAEAYRQSLPPLGDALRRECAAPERPAVEAAFRDVTLAWGRLQPLLQGPLGDPVLASRIAFWPDRHGTAGRQLGTAIQKRDPTVTDPATLATKSAALSGLHALERLLFEDAGEEREFACAYAAALVQVQARRAGEAAAAFARAPRAQDPLLQGLVATLRDSLDGILRLKLEAPQGKSPETARGQRAEFWRSDASLPVIDANLASLEELMAGPGGLSALLRTGPESAAVATIIERRFAAARQTARAIPLPLAAAVTDPATRPAVVALADQIRELRGRIAERLGPALGVAGGFNALDGD